MLTHNLLNCGLVTYAQMDQLQRKIHARVAAGTVESCLLIFQTEPTFTAGRHTRPEDIVDTTLPVIHTDRAGSITWHGPGQLVIYPIIKMIEPVDLIKYIRGVEAAVLETCRNTWSIPVERIEGRAGVWVRDPSTTDKKIAAIGLKISKATSLHGVALNIDPDFSTAFSGIVPCGLGDAGVTSLAAQGVNISIDDAVAPLVEALHHKLSPLLAYPHGTPDAQPIDDLLETVGLSATLEISPTTQLTTAPAEKELHVHPA